MICVSQFVKSCHMCHKPASLLLSQHDQLVRTKPTLSWRPKNLGEVVRDCEQAHLWKMFLMVAPIAILGEGEKIGVAGVGSWGQAHLCLCWIKKRKRKSFFRTTGCLKQPVYYLYTTPSDHLPVVWWESWLWQGWWRCWRPDSCSQVSFSSWDTVSPCKFCKIMIMALCGHCAALWPSSLP